MGNNCCDKANTNAKDIESIKASMPDPASGDTPAYVTKDDFDTEISSLKSNMNTMQAPTVDAITSVIKNDPNGQIAQAITSTLGKSFVTKGLLGLDNSQSTLTFDGNMVLKCSSGSGQDCLTVQGSGALASARQWKAGGATPSPSAWSLGSDGKLAANTIAASGDIVGQNVGGTNSVFTGGPNYDAATLTLNNSGIVAAKGVEVTDGSYSLISSKGPFTNFTLKSSATSDDTDLVLGNKDNTLNLLGNLNLVATPSAPSGALTVASGITGQGTLSVGSSSTFGGQMVSNATGGLVMNAGSISVKRMTANGHVFLDVDSNGWPVLISKDYCANTSDKYPGCLSDSGS